MYAKRFGRLVGCVLAAALSAPFAEGGAAGPQLDLRGSEWGFAEETVDPRRSVQFDGEGGVSGSGGCNHFAGTFEQQDDLLRIGQLMTTLIGCAPEIARLEAEFLKALRAADRIEATHGVLKIYGKDGALLLDLIRRDWD